MTTTPHLATHPSDVQADPLRPDQLRCGCGATADRDGQCDKCHARARWQRRTTGRRNRADRPPSMRRHAPHRRDAAPDEGEA